MAGGQFHLIGIGAAEGSIEPLRTILQGLPAGVNGAFFILNHLPPDFPSFTRQLLEHYTPMPIHQAEHGMTIRPGHLYLLPANHYMTVFRGVLYLQRREPRPKSNRAIDIFLTSLAADAGCCAVGVLLSGNGSDGVEGLGDIRQAGGITIVQDPATAKYPKMSENAANAGAAIFTLEPAGIAELLIELMGSR
jgi:two-component system CheB/CheR fusion protein